MFVAFLLLPRADVGLDESFVLTGFLAAILPGAGDNPLFLGGMMVNAKAFMTGFAWFHQNRSN